MITKNIVKIQKPITDGDSWLAYNETKSVLFQFDPPKQLKIKMKSRYKAYFYAVFKNGEFLGIADEAPEQKW